jgi:hypothetical protein
MDICTDRSTARERRARPHGSVLLTLLCATAIALAPAVALAGTTTEISKRGGLGISSALLTLVYAPVKVVYATGGLLVGGLAYCFSGGDREVAKVVVTPSLLGDYVVTPQHLSRERPLEFFGRDPSYDARNVNVAAGPAVEPEFEPEAEPAVDGDGW